jgi:peptidyl-prolyl cis-trans isomerase B (cyclophilin B)
MRALQLLTVLLVTLVSHVTLAEDRPQVALQTNVGEIVLELDAERAPTSVDNFLQYVSSGFYNDTLFHRVIDGFMIQGGGFSAKFMRKQTSAPIRNEANNGLKNRAYTIAMARTNAPHSATSQFFINTVDNTNLDHTDATGRGWGYAVFGRVIDGFDVVDTIGSVATGSAGPFPRDVPREPIIIESATLLGDSADAQGADTAVKISAKPASAAQ